MVIRSNLHAAKAAEIAFSVVRADAFVLERNRVIDALRVPSGMKRVPTAALVGIERGKVLDVMAHVGSGVTLVGSDFTRVSSRRRKRSGFPKAVGTGRAMLPSPSPFDPKCQVRSIPISTFIAMRPPA